MDSGPKITQRGGDKGDFPIIGYIPKPDNPDIQASFIPAKWLRNFIRNPDGAKDSRRRIIVAYKSRALRQIRFSQMRGQSADSLKCHIIINGARRIEHGTQGGRRERGIFSDAEGATAVFLSFNGNTA